jgi:glutathione S-transferase
MKIIESALTPSAKRLSLFLAEKGIEIERQQIDLKAGANLTSEFKSLSANGLIPVLQLDNGTTICESIAICRYFEALYPEKTPLFGHTPLEQAQVEMWQRIVELQGLMVAFQAFRNLTGIYKDRENCVSQWGEESKQRVIAFLPILEKQLRTHQYVAGEAFSIADITAFVLILFLARIEIPLTHAQTTIRHWYDRIADRPAFKSQLKQG